MEYFGENKEIKNDTAEGKQLILEKQIEELKKQLSDREDENLKLRKRIVELTDDNRKSEIKLDNQSTTIQTLLNLLTDKCNKRVEDAPGIEDFLARQRRIFQNKVNHGFNTTNIYQEARYILEEVAELMRAVEKNDRENMIEELADIVIFSYGCAEVARLGSLDNKIFEKMNINEQREYTQTSEGDFVKTGNEVENND